MAEKREMILLLDELDYEAIVRCIALRERFIGGTPDGASDLNGTAIAEICRGWE